MQNKWYVIETACYPDSYKVVNDYYRADNAACNYFPTQDKAQHEADERNEREAVIDKAFDTVAKSWQ
jgi:hypothetical protein